MTDLGGFLARHRAERSTCLRREGRSLTESDLDTIRNICRCGTCTRIREAIVDGAGRM